MNARSGGRWSSSSQHYPSRDFCCLRVALALRAINEAFRKTHASARPLISSRRMRYVGPRPTTEHAAMPRCWKARERDFRVDFRPRVFVATNQRRRLVPRDGRRAEIAASRRVSTSAANARALSRHAELEAKRPTYPDPLTFQMQDGHTSSDWRCASRATKTSIGTLHPRAGRLRTSRMQVDVSCRCSPWSVVDEASRSV